MEASALVRDGKHNDECGERVLIGVGLCDLGNHPELLETKRHTLISFSNNEEPKNSPYTFNFTLTPFDGAQLSDQYSRKSVPW